MLRRGQLRSPGRGRLAGWLIGASLLAIAQGAVLGVDNDEVVAIASKVSSDYVRKKSPDGTFVTEAYTFGEGGHFSGPMNDFTIDQLKFMDVARVIVGPLADRKYLPSKDQKDIKLLVMVYWGTTDGAGDASESIAAQHEKSANLHSEVARSDYRQLQIAAGNAASSAHGGSPTAGLAANNSASNAADWGVADGPMALIKDPNVLEAKVALQTAQAELESSLMVSTMENRERDRANMEKARILGYDSALEQTAGLEFTARGTRRKDLIDELEDKRYYVVLMVYDFQLLLKEKKHKLLWETRYSVRERGVDFSKQLASMTEKASRYFGQDSHGLVRKSRPRDESITQGELKILGTVPGK
jgi:hypothetical protein